MVFSFEKHDFEGASASRCAKKPNGRDAQRICKGTGKGKGKSCETTAMREKMEREKGGKNFLIAVSAAARRFNALPTAVVVGEATLPLGKRGGKGKGPHPPLT